MVLCIFGKDCLSYKQVIFEVIFVYEFFINIILLGLFFNINSKFELFYEVIGEIYFLYDLVYNFVFIVFMELGL